MSRLFRRLQLQRLLIDEPPVLFDSPSDQGFIEKYLPVRQQKTPGGLLVEDAGQDANILLVLLARARKFADEAAWCAWDADLPGERLLIQHKESHGERRDKPNGIYTSGVPCFRGHCPHRPSA